MSLFINAWKGNTSLAKAFWLVYVIFGIVIYLLVNIVFSMLMPNFTNNPIYHNSMISSIIFPYTLFSAICVWRCAKNSNIFWNILAKIIVIIGVVGGIVALLYATHLVEVPNVNVNTTTVVEEQIANNQ